MAESRTAVIAALTGNGLLGALKGASAAATGSAAMLAETFHSIADTGNQVLLLLGLRLAHRSPDELHPFGHGRNVYFWAFVVSMMLFSLGGAFAIWEAISKLTHPGPHESSVWSYVVLGGAFVFETASLVVALRSVRQAKGDTPFRQFWRDNRDPTLTTVVLEDSAALLSLGIAAAGLELSRASGNAVWDAAASATIGTILIVVALLLAFENYSLIIGEAMSPMTAARIRDLVEADPAVDDLVALHTMHIGPNAVLVVAQVKFRGEIAVAEIEAAVGRLEQSIMPLTGRQTTRRMIVIEPTPSPGEVATAAM
ncbi:MAG TPA: cation diffusion facilitator family transporter [Methylomirabilota bacterium]|nr:cation diffusion facilitator family transporter [Methylomirabilota bacterium]